MSFIDNKLDDPKQLHDFLFKLYDFAFLVSGNLTDASKPYATNGQMYALMAYIEDLMDTYGRQLVADSAKAAGLDADQSLQDAHQQLDVLRNMLTELKELPPAVAAVDEAAKRLKDNWGTRE